MRRDLVGLVVGAALAGAIVYARRSPQGDVADAGADASVARPARGAAPGAGEPAESAARLDFSEMLQPGPALAPSKRVLELAGKRVRMVGFMAEMELPPRGGFYLVPRPVRCDEAGGGTADLPLENVLVLSPSAGDAAIAYLPGPLEATGILEVGNRTGADGRVSAIRLLLDRPPGERRSRPRASATK